MKPFAFILLTAACGQPVTGGPDASDASPETNTSTDAGSDVIADGSATCWDKTFGTPVPVAGINTTGHEGYIRLSQDELTAYFYVSYWVDGGTGHNRLAMATRPSRADAFGAPQPVPGLTAPAGHDYLFPTVTADGLSIFFQEDYSGTILAATRATTTDSFGVPAAVAGANTPNAGAPYVTPLGETLYWSDTTGISRGDLSGTSVGNVSSLGIIDAWSSVVSGDQLVLFFATNGGASGTDIWVATRTSKSDLFATTASVAEVNSAAADEPSWISPDGCRLYLQSERDIDAGLVWVAER